LRGAIIGPESLSAGTVNVRVAVPYVSSNLLSGMTPARIPRYTV
jgi:hypothetical protein